MKKIQLNNGMSVLVDDADFEWLNTYGWHYHINGARSNGNVGGYYKGIFMHQLLLRPHGKFITDHEDNNNLNNQRSNLRYATRRQNRANAKVQSDNKSGIKGVRQERNGRWHAYIYSGGRQVNLGRFANKEEAGHAYNVAAMQYFGEFSRLNEESYA